MKINTVAEYLFFLGVGFLFTHELDAITNQEWKVLPILNEMSEELAKFSFVIIHVPLFAITIALISSRNKSMRHKARLWIAITLSVHGVLHAAYLSHEHYQFDSMLSNILIFGGALCGLAYLALNTIGKANKTE